MPENKELNRAYNYASRLLKIRPRSENEIRFRLSQKKYSQDVAEALIKSLKDSGYVDDFNFAVSWVRERIAKPLGIRRLEFELREKGVAKEIIGTVIAQAKKDYPERKIIDGLIEEKFAKFLNNPIDEKVRRKIQGFLLRRGFSPDKVIEAIEKLVA
ncbi:MAG: regulatory protein RecX [Candidatus Omnitrophota bacterium]|nr:regulatory protein RecX [Candidatus Omnitrophota bacterium]